MQKKKVYIISTLITLVHFLSTFFSDKLIFKLDSINKINYYGCKFILLIILFIFWNFLTKLVINKSVEKKLYLKYFLIYIVPMAIMLLLCWPGTWYGSDVNNFYYLSVEANFLYYLNYLSSVFYIIAYMIFPFTSGAIILQTIIFGLVCSYIVKNLFDIYKTKLVYAMYIPFFMFHTIFYTFFANRPVMFGICYLFFMSFLIIEKMKKKDLSFLKLIFLSFITAVLAIWRSESIYLLIASPIFIFLTYKIRFNVNNLIKIVSIIFIFYITISLPQKINDKIVSSDIPSNRNLPMFIGPLSYMLSQDIKGNNLENDLTNIDKVIDVELMKKRPSYTDTPSVWEEGGCIKEYTKKEYDAFIKSYINVIKNNIPLFIKTKILTFANASTIYIDNFTSKDLYSNDEDKLFNRKDTLSIFGYRVRETTYKIIEGKFGKDQTTNIVYKLFGNLLIPMIVIGLLFVLSIIKKNLYMFLVSGMLIGHSCILFFTAPASYFMYYFNIFLMGWFLAILLILNKKVNML